ncbi:MAG: alpha/beta fold hydrolase BchO [Pseudomonadota bacterium]
MQQQRQRSVRPRARPLEPAPAHRTAAPLAHPFEHRERGGPVRWRWLEWPGPRADAPLALLLHGTGASAESWSALGPRLARRWRVVAPDLPGHAQSAVEHGRELSLPFMARALAGLAADHGWRPQWLVGHSAGAAIALQTVLDGAFAPQGVIALNGALLPLDGPVGRWFSPLARALALQPLVPHLFSWHAHVPGVVERLLYGTGSRLPPSAVQRYRRLVTDPGHAGGALRMMAAWDLGTLEAALPSLRVPLHLVVGEADRMLPPAHAERVRGALRSAQVHRLPGLGHLAHEEDAEAVAALIERLAGPAATGGPDNGAPSEARPEARPGVRSGTPSGTGSEAAPGKPSHR